MLIRTDRRVYEGSDLQSAAKVRVIGVQMSLKIIRVGLIASGELYLRLQGSLWAGTPAGLSSILNVWHGTLGACFLQAHNGRI